MIASNGSPEQRKLETERSVFVQGWRWGRRRDREIPKDCGGPTSGEEMLKKFL